MLSIRRFGPFIVPHGKNGYRRTPVLSDPSWNREARSQHDPDCTTEPPGSSRWAALISIPALRRMVPFRRHFHPASDPYFRAIHQAQCLQEAALRREMNHPSEMDLFPGRLLTYSLLTSERLTHRLNSFNYILPCIQK